MAWLGKETEEKKVEPSQYCGSEMALIVLKNNEEKTRLEMDAVWLDHYGIV